jgi:hypothetical protein
LTPAFLAEWNRLWPAGSRMLWMRNGYDPVEVTTAFPAYGGAGYALVPVRADGMSTGPVVPLSQLIPIPNHEVTPIV